MTDQPTKRCTRCKLSKPVDDFARRTSAADGRQDYCKQCMSDYQSDDRIRQRDTLETVQRAREALAIFGRDCERVIDAVKRLHESGQKVTEEVSKLGNGR